MPYAPSLPKGRYAPFWLFWPPCPFEGGAPSKGQGGGPQKGGGPKKGHKNDNVPD